MSLEQKLAEERRGRLAAERLLEQKSRELFEANRKLGEHARMLSDEIDVTRQENTQVREELQEVSTAYAIAERRLWDSLETVRDGFAVFDADGHLVAANPAFLGVFDGLEEVCIGARYPDILRLIIEEGLVDTEGDTPEGWLQGMVDRWSQDEIPDRIIRL
ncbi:MAG: PAS-domain containing protein, partial [Pseudomonadota bacterium]|nr:PAS-domain containing protein [Pseudomonadota bacterium]